MSKSKGRAKQAQGKAKGKAKGKAVKPAAFPGSYAVFTGDFSPGTSIRSKNPKILKFRTYGKLREFLLKAVADGKSRGAVAAELGVVPSRITEFAVCLGIVKPCGKPKAAKLAKAAKANGEVTVDRPVIRNGKLVMEEPRS